MTIPYGSLTWRQGDRGMSTICWRLWSEVLWSWNLHSGRFDQPKTLETSQIKPPNWEIGWTFFGVLLAHLAWFERLGISTTWTKNGMWGRWFNPYSASSWLDFQGQEFIYHLTLNRTNINPHEKLKGWNMRLVSSMFIKILDIQEDEIKQFNTCIITRSHFECFALNICVFVWLAFGFWCHILWWFQTLFPNSTSFGVFRDSKGFGAELPSADPPWAARRFHQGFTKVLQVSLCLWFSGAKGSVEGSPITSLNLSPSSSTLFCIFHQQRWLWCLLGPKLTRLSSWALCSKWLSQHKSFFGVFQFLTLVSQSPALFGANGCCFRKGSVEGSANYSLHLSLRLLLHKSSLEGSANCALHLSPSCVNCWHVSPIQKSSPQKTTHHVVAVGVVLGKWSNLTWAYLFKFVGSTMG